jgi:hypothetical protein
MSIRKLTAALAAATLATAAQAMPVSRTYNFQTSFFTGSFSLDFDNGSNVGPTATGLSLLSFSTTLSGWNGAVLPTYQYVMASDKLLFGFRGNPLLDLGLDDFSVGFSAASTDSSKATIAQFNWMAGRTSGRTDGLVSSSSSVTVTSGKVPEPGSLALLLATGLAGVCAGGFRTRR